MRNLLFALLVLVGANAAFAGDEPTTGVAVFRVKNSDVFKVIYKAENEGKVKLNVYNADAELVFAESFMSTAGFIRPLNFTGLRKGEYTFELIGENGKKTETVVYGDLKEERESSASVSKSEAYIHISKLDSDHNKFLVAINEKLGGSVKVKIYDNLDNLLHSEIKTIDVSFAQVYDLQKVYGQVKIEVEGKNGARAVAKF